MAPMYVWSLLTEWLTEWKGQPFSQLTWMLDERVGLPPAGVPTNRCRTPPPLLIEGWGRQQQRN